MARAPFAPTVAAALLVTALPLAAQHPSYEDLVGGGSRPPAPTPAPTPDTPPAAPEQERPPVLGDLPVLPSGGSLAEVRPLAMVNGEALTTNDVALNMRMLQRNVPDMPFDLLLHTSRRLLAEELLLSREADRLGMRLTDEMVESYWERRYGYVPDFEDVARREGTTVAHQRDVARRSAQADMYVLHKVGLRREMAQLVPVDPVMARIVSVTPRQLREYYQENRDRFRRPAMVGFDVFLLQDEAAAQGARRMLETGGTPQVPVAPQTLPHSALGELFPEPMAAWIGRSSPGDVSAPIPTEDGEWLVVRIREQLPPQEAAFADVQGDLRNAIQMDLLIQARQALVSRLSHEAVFWPGDLFEKVPRPDAEGPVAGPAAGPGRVASDPPPP